MKINLHFLGIKIDTFTFKYPYFHDFSLIPVYKAVKYLSKHSFITFGTVRSDIVTILGLGRH